MGPGAADIAEVVTEVKERLSDLQPPPTLEPQQARFRLFDSIATFLIRATQAQCLMVVLDNLHWADRSSLLLLEFLSQDLMDNRLLVVGTYRDTELTGQHSLNYTLGELARHPHFSRILLRGLNEDEVSSFIYSRAGFAPQQNLVKSVHTQTQGNPLFLTQAVQLLTREGELTSEGACQLRDGELEIPVGIREVIRRRLDRLSDRCNQVLTVASVVGREFGVDLLERLMTETGMASPPGLTHRLNSNSLLETVEEALNARVIEEMPHSTSRYQFAHVLIQNTLAQGLSALRRSGLHRRIGEALETLYEGNVAAHATELAYHFTEAEPVSGPEKLVHYSLLAGEQMLATYSWEEAMAYFQRGLEANGVPLTDTEPAKDAESAALLFGLGRAQLAILPRERFEEALTSLDRSFEYYADAGDVTSAVVVAEYPLPRGVRQRSKVERRIERALTLVPPDSAAAGRLLSSYGMELGRFENDYDRAQEAFERALAIAQRGSDVNLQMRTLADWSQVDYFHLHLTECLEKSLQVVELASYTDDPHLKVNAHLHALQTLIHLGDSKSAVDHAEAALALAERLKVRPWLANVLRCGVNLYRFLGDWARARELALRHLALESDAVPLLKELVSLEYELGEFEQGAVHLKKMQEVMRRTPPRPGPEYGDTSLVSHFASRITGSTDYLEVAGQAAQVVLSSALAHPFWIEIVRTGLALRAVQTGDSALAKEQYLALAGLPGKMRGSYISADRLQGLLAHTLGNLDQAAAHFEEALTFCRTEGFRPELAWTCYDYAATLLKDTHDHAHLPGNRTKAIGLLDEAWSISRELGMSPLMERVVALQELVQLQSPRGNARIAPAYPNGLTRREVEVLRFVATGKSNTEIAEKLVLSRRTVERHISNIYSKTDTHGRAEATAFAFIHGLISSSRIT
jgi:DNA-binding CsgD family transcriptional regulator